MIHYFDHDPLQMDLISCLIHLFLAFKHDWFDYVMIHRLGTLQACKCICFCFDFSRLTCPPTTSAYCFSRTVWFDLIQFHRTAFDYVWTLQCFNGSKILNNTTALLKFVITIFFGKDVFLQDVLMWGFPPTKTFYKYV